MNRTLADGRPILIDGMFPLAHNVHGALEAWEAGEEEAERSYADMRARAAFLNAVRGEWIVDVDKSREASNEELAAMPQAPVTLKMLEGGGFRVSAPNIVSGVIEIAIEAEGAISVEPIIYNDRLQFEFAISSLDISKSRVTVAGIDLPGLAETIEGYIRYFKSMQKVEIKRIDESEYLHIESPDHTLVLDRAKSGSEHAGRTRHILATPRPFDQKSENHCWAAATACFMRILRTANDEPSIIAPMHDNYPQFTIQGVIQRLQKFIKDNPATKAHMGPGGQLDGVPASLEDFITTAYNINSGTEYSESKFSIKDVKAQIDQNRFVLLGYSKPKWSPVGRPHIKIWHLVVAFGYDTDLDKILVADSNGPTVGGFYVNPKWSYYMTAQRADEWDKVSREWKDEHGRVVRVEHQPIGSGI